MDSAWKRALVDDAATVGVALDAASTDRIAEHIDLLLAWNAKVNLTSIVEPAAIRAKHCVDSLAAVPLVPGEATTILDMGSGAGFPGIPWLCAKPALEVTMGDSVAKKIGFIKTVLAHLKLAHGKAIHARLDHPYGRERVGKVDLVVSRAFTDLERFLPMARDYLRPGGWVVAMLGPRETADPTSQIVEAAGFTIDAERTYELAQGQGTRRALRLVPRGTV